VLGILQRMKIPSVVPVIVVDDIRDGIAFYQLLGFREEKAFSFADDTGRLVHAHLTKGDAAIFLGVPGASYFADNPRSGRIEKAGRSDRGLGVTFILQTDDLDGVYKTIRNEKLEILYEPAQEWYGDRVFLFVDPFGYEWKVSQPRAEGQAD
jgi:uncharacterized glyoxalase superfamily protein PhnB